LFEIISLFELVNNALEALVLESIGAAVKVATPVTVKVPPTDAVPDVVNVVNAPELGVVEPIGVFWTLPPTIDPLIKIDADCAELGAF